jgi:hypothetical protein
VVRVNGVWNGADEYMCLYVSLLVSVGQERKVIKRDRERDWDRVTCQRGKER